MLLSCVFAVQALQRAYDRAIGLELQHMRERKHVFKKARPAGGSGSSKEQQQKAGGSSKQKPKTKLSFAEDEEEEEQ